MTQTTESTIETWESKRDRERKEARAKTLALYNGVAAHLDGWAVVERENPCYDGMYSHYIAKGELKIDLSPGSGAADRGKVIVTGYWPQLQPNGQYMSPRDVNEDSPRIGVSESRGYAAIAKQIKKRFLPKYERVMAMLIERRKQHQSFEAGCDALCDKLAEYGRNERDRRRVHLSASGGYGTATVNSPTSVTLELRSLSPHVALRVLAALEE